MNTQGDLLSILLGNLLHNMSCTAVRVSTRSSTPFFQEMLFAPQHGHGTFRTNVTVPLLVDYRVISGFTISKDATIITLIHTSLYMGMFLFLDNSPKSGNLAQSPCC